MEKSMVETRHEIMKQIHKLVENVGEKSLEVDDHFGEASPEAYLLSDVLDALEKAYEVVSLTKVGRAK